MNKEKLVLSLVAILLGLFVAGGAFYIYQMTRTISEPPPQEPLATSAPTIAVKKSNLLIVDNPKNEEVFNKRIISVKGKTEKGAKLIVSTQSIDEVVIPNNNGDFTLTLTLEDGVNVINFLAIYPDGSEESLTRTVTSTSEDF